MCVGVGVNNITIIGDGNCVGILYMATLCHCMYIKSQKKHLKKCTSM